MSATPQTNSAAPRFSGGTTTRADLASDDTAQPSLTSGFGSVMEREQDIKSAIGDRLRDDDGPNAAALNRILRHQQRQLGANIVLLEQRYETLPHPLRFEALHAAHRRRAQTGIAALAPAERGQLPSLIAQHLGLLRAIHALIAQCPDGQRGELILTEVARNHEEMAWMLTALLKEDESVRDSVPAPIVARRRAAAGAGEADWENEGGASGGE